MGNVHPPGSGQRATEGMEASNEGTADVYMEDNEKDNSNSGCPRIDTQIEPTVVNSQNQSNEDDILSKSSTFGSTDHKIVDRSISKLENDTDEKPNEAIASTETSVDPTDPINPPEEKQDTGANQDVEVPANKATDRRSPTLLTYPFSHLLCAVGKRGIVRHERMPIWVIEAVPSD
jgi:hypothetical protein